MANENKKKIWVDEPVHRRVKASAAMAGESITDHAADLLTAAINEDILDDNEDDNDE